MYPELTSKADILRMLEELYIARENILGTCGAFTVEMLNDPVYQGTWSILKNLAHLANAERFMMAYIFARPNAPAKETLPKEPIHELQAIRVALDEAHAEAIAFLKANDEKVLLEKCVFGKEQRPETVGGLYFHIIEHEIGHRTFIQHKMKKLQAAKKEAGPSP